jgi:mRNA interferase RelE/StbE
MPHQILIRRPAEKEIASLPPKIRSRVAEKIRALAEDPRPAGCKKLSGEDRAWRIRIGDYRVVYEVNDTARYVEVRVVAHRKDVYR